MTLDSEFAICQALGRDINGGHLKNLGKFLSMLREREIMNAQRLAKISDQQAACLAILAVGLYDKIISMESPDGLLTREMKRIMREMKGRMQEEKQRNGAHESEEGSWEEEF